MAAAAKRYHLSNGNGGSEPFVTEAMRADLDEVFETGSILLEALGQPLFRPLIEKTSQGTKGTEPEEWFITGPEANARGSYSSDGFVVREGSYCRMMVAKSAKDGFVDSARKRLIADGIIVEEGGHFVFKEDFLFKAPSGAAMVILGRTANGWMEWKNKDGVQIDQLRKQAAMAAISAEGEE